MHSNPTKRGRQIAEMNARYRAQDLYNHLSSRGVFLENPHLKKEAWDAIRDWMRAEFYRGIDYGRRLRARGQR